MLFQPNLLYPQVILFKIKNIVTIWDTLIIIKDISQSP